MMMMMVSPFWCLKSPENRICCTSKYIVQSVRRFLCATKVLWEYELIEVGEIFGSIFDSQGIYLFFGFLGDWGKNFHF